MTVEQIKSQLLTLTQTERADLAYFLLQSLDGEEESEEEVEVAWAAELSRRAEEIKSGKVAGIPAEEVHARLREKLR